MPSWQKPTDAQIDAALQRIRSPDFEAYFFARLDNPEWVAPLARRGVFARPPAPIVDADGRTMFPVWPATKYLVRMASAVPADVVAVLDGIDVANMYVASDLVDAALEMPPEIARSLVSSVARAAQAGSLDFHLMETADLCARLAEAGEAGASLALADGLFLPTHSRGDARRDAYWYHKALERVVPVLARTQPIPLLHALSRWLTRAIEAKQDIDRESGDDRSYWWRQAIEEHAQNNDSDFAGNLVGCVRAGFEIAIQDAGVPLHEAIRIIDRRRYLVFRRLVVHLIDTFAAQDRDLARGVMLDRAFFDDFRFKHEYAVLMRKRFGLLSTDEQATWLGWVWSGPAQEEEEGLEEDLRIARAAYWRYCRLHWIREHLGGAEKDFYDRMLAEHGEPELADLHMMVSAGSWGNISPVKSDELEGRPFEEVVHFVRTWRPDRRDFLGPDINGLADTFEAYVAANPEALSREAEVLVGAPAIYVRGFLKQMTGALKAGRSLELAPVFALAHWVLGRPQGEKTLPETGRDALVDKDWQWTRDQVSALVKTICEARLNDQPRFPLSPLREQLWPILSTLYPDPSPSSILSDGEPPDPRQRDYLTLGINSPRGKAVEACLEYARWVANHVKEVQSGNEVVLGGFEAMPEVREMLEWQLADENRSFEALAVIGLHLSLILWIDRAWLTDNAARLFDLPRVSESPEKAHGWAAWNSFLIWVRPHVEFYRLFNEQFEYSVMASASIVPTEQSREGPMEHLGEHLMVLYLRGDLPLTSGSPVRDFIDRTHPIFRRYSISFVGRILWREKGLPEEMIDRAMELWEYYWDGPGKVDAREQPDEWLFGVWFASRQLPGIWAVEQLSNFVEVVAVPEPDHIVMERLAELASDDLEAAVRILDRMARGDREGWRIHIWREPARAVLRQGLAAGGAPRALAESTLDYLGRRGYPDFLTDS
jgi:hypothetical protein